MVKELEKLLVDLRKDSSDYPKRIGSLRAMYKKSEEEFKELIQKNRS